MKQHTIVTIPSFQSTYLQNERNLYIYLPPSYQEETKKTYPVLYMHDGQNIFHSAFNGQSWNIHKVIDQLISENKMEEIIVVGIPNMEEERPNEYSFHTLDVKDLSIPHALSCSNPKGELYECFLVEEVKPFIDATFRTKKEAEHTALMGSSRGGAITYHIGFRRPDVFSMLGILCPYFYYVDPKSLREFPQLTQPNQKKAHRKIWMDVGEYEGLLIRVNHVKEAAKHLLKIGYTYEEELVYYQDPFASHTEKDWEERVHAPLLYFFGQKSDVSSIKLTGRSFFGLNEKIAALNAIKTYKNGMVMNELRGSYIVKDEGILEVLEDGTVVPKSVGQTTVTLQVGELTISKDIEIVNYVSDKMLVSIQVETKEAMRGTSTLYADLPLKKVNDHHFYNMFILPIDTGFRFQIHTDDGRGEIDPYKKKVYHQIKIEKPLEFTFVVNDWG
ncbi:alpha/beta hydrolase-fold protein [Bacillus sp. CGMCC 1.16541]|uniref:alpha/beta hydrolase n=1 Tax=Bacillus sp. CGMCC 1.16541 TaxID=2185143 RepID=UPI0013A54ADE|nr:alpha/beta hydrolase-fold protein [Bacillus sp. CGMCC 1.16541]